MWEKEKWAKHMSGGGAGRDEGQSTLHALSRAFSQEGEVTARKRRKR